MKIWCHRCKKYTDHRIYGASSVHYRSTVGRGVSEYYDMQCTECKLKTKDVDLGRD